MPSGSSALREVFSQLSWRDKLLPPAIVICIVVGIVISVYAPQSQKAFEGAEVLRVSVPLAIGMIIMIVPPLCCLQLENWRMFLKKRMLKQLAISLVLNWIVCPFFMLSLAWMTLFDLDEYRNGIILIGLGRCIAMVMIWNQIAHGDENLCAILVIANSLLQLVLYAPYKIFFCDILGGAGNLTTSSQSMTELYSTVAKTVGFFLGIPLALGVIIRAIGVGLFGKKVYESRIIKFISPWSTIGLLYTIVVIFINKGDAFISDIGTSFRCFVPLVAYFVIVWFSVFFGLRICFGRGSKPREEERGLLCGCEKQLQSGVDSKMWKRYCASSYPEIATQSFTAASNNFELSLAVAISLYGVDSQQVVAATYGPLLEIPVLIILTVVSRYFQIAFLWSDEE
ncbi:hypothetical protein FOA43_001965 [Brettanomyces nanus]|uniref:Arsenical-resistance protein n=1 Tax=Eeniella nana TaxID=13502 RepID=A0A875S145_EENNA|nr:uncharacterized protein FOA43_001965 [Brettanomyces nanus]QPG74633.1 hypothetical protein FOA43_001965 [Brettanomyces nanus]